MVPASPNTPESQDFDHVIVGGGLQGGLLALALLQSDPKRRVALVDRETGTAPSQTWCFHADDIPPESAEWIEPLIEHRWPDYAVRFAGFERTLHSAYRGLTAAHLRERVDEAFAARPDCKLIRGHHARVRGSSEVQLDEGSILRGHLLTLATGAADLGKENPNREVGVGAKSNDRSTGAGFQKFLGWEIQLDRDHRLERPLVMDTSVDQEGGFRFFYVLPFGPRRVLIEDTRFADRPELDLEQLRREIANYIARSQQLGSSFELVREESGVLPMPWKGQRFETEGPPLLAGMRGSWFHPATGYSFPLAVRIAQLVATTPPEQLFNGPLRALARSYAGPARFARFLNRLLFKWFEPHQRIHVFERFYRLPEPVIRRFYAMRPTWIDRARILTGRPPRGFSLKARLYASSRRARPAHQPPQPHHA